MLFADAEKACEILGISNRTLYRKYVFATDNALPCHKFGKSRKLRFLVSDLEELKRKQEEQHALEAQLGYKVYKKRVVVG